MFAQKNSEKTATYSLPGVVRHLPRFYSKQPCFICGNIALGMEASIFEGGEEFGGFSGSHRLFFHPVCPSCMTKQVEQPSIIIDAIHEQLATTPEFDVESPEYLPNMITPMGACFDTSNDPEVFHTMDYDDE